MGKKEKCVSHIWTSLISSGKAFLVKCLIFSVIFSAIFSVIFSAMFSVILISLHLIDELEQGILSGVHPHGPHRPAQLFGADVSSSVNVKLIESLDRKGNLVKDTESVLQMGRRMNGSPV